MSISHLRGILYAVAKLLGDLQAARKAVRQGSIAPIARRVERRLVGRLVGKILGRIT